MKSLIKFTKDIKQTSELFGFVVTTRKVHSLYKDYLVTDAYHKDFPDFDMRVEHPLYLFNHFDSHTDWDYIVENFTKRVVNSFVSKLIDKKVNNDRDS